MERCPNPLDLRRTLSLLEGFPNYQPDPPRGLFRTGQGGIALVVRENSSFEEVDLPREVLEASRQVGFVSKEASR